MVIHPVGHVGILLDLRNDDALADGVYRSGGNVEQVALLYGNGVQHLLQGILLNPAAVFLFGDGMGEAIVQIGARICLQHIPHFAFAVLVLFFHGIHVIGVHLNGQIIPGINKLGDDGKFPKNLAVGAENPPTVLLYVGVQGHPRVRAGGHIAGAVGMAAQLPGLRQTLSGKGLVVFFHQAVTAPEIVLAGWQ